MDEIKTIAGLATAPAPAGIAIIRISGPRTRRALRALFRSKLSPLKERRRLVFGELIDYKSGEVIDRALAVYMPGPNSFTGENVAEFQFHGSPILVQKILRSLYSFGISPAEPGEFTKRAFLNGKMDLVQAEAVSELINSSSERALKIAGEHLGGRFSQAIDEIGEPLRNSLAELEASIDFPEEGINPDSRAKLADDLEISRTKIGRLLATASYGATVREGFRVLLCGRPNVGKSSILNLLLGRQRAIVTEVSGTTRDLIEEETSLAGYRFIFCDSAGIAETNDRVEQIGIELARSKIPWADLILFIVDATDAKGEWQNMLPELKGIGKKVWMITNKIDLNSAAIGSFVCDSSICTQNVYLSAKTKAGFEGLQQALVDEVEGRLGLNSDSANIVTSERHGLCLAKASESLARAINGLRSDFPVELIAADIQHALVALEEIVGKTFTEDILGRIFSKFCIGK
jgi:tRNA modification GTPase